jgi:energy-coupling factor transporter transmembrane protein EcfT
MVPAYRRKDNLIHRLHPASMLLLVLSLMVVALVADNPFFQAGVIAATAMLALAAGVIREWFSWWKICAVVGIATMKERTCYGSAPTCRCSGLSR